MVSSFQKTDIWEDTHNADKQQKYQYKNTDGIYHAQNIQHEQIIHDACYDRDESEYYRNIPDFDISANEIPIFFSDIPCILFEHILYQWRKKQRCC